MAASVDLGELVVGASEADVQSFDFAEPAFVFGFGDARDEVVAGPDPAGVLEPPPGLSDTSEGV